MMLCPSPFPLSAGRGFLEFVSRSSLCTKDSGLESVPPQKQNLLRERQKRDLSEYERIRFG